MKIKVENFQRIKKAELEVDGLGVIMGPSNRGKSAVVRAISAALFGMVGDVFVRDGEKDCEVEVILGTDVIKWMKPKKDLGKGLRVLINGEEHTKIGRDLLALTSKLGIFELESRGEKLRPQIGMQYDKPFLVAESESTAAEAMQSLTRVDIVTKAQDKAKLRKKGMEKTVEMMRSTQNKLKDELILLGDVGELETSMSVLRDKENDIQALEKQLFSITELYDRWLELKPIDISGSMVRLRSIEMSLKGLESVIMQVEWSTRKPINTQTLRYRVESLLNNYIEVKQAQALINTINGLQKQWGETLPIVIENEKEILSIVIGLLVDVKETLDLVRSLEDLSEKRKTCMNELDWTKVDHVSFNMEKVRVEDKLKEHKLCPLCGGAFNYE